MGPHWVAGGLCQIFVPLRGTVLAYMHLEEEPRVKNKEGFLADAKALQCWSWPLA